MSFPALFKPVTIGSLTLPNRMIMAPLTRCRSGLNHIPTAEMAKYYSQRATAGLIIAEATMVQENQSAFYQEPGIYNKEQIAAWKLTTDAVHQAGGRIFLQIWHGGRTAAPENNNGTVPVAPSAIAIEGHQIGGEFNPTGEKIPYSTPRALETKEVEEMVQVFVQAAKNAIEAGFDGVEVHGANGYLLNQFLDDGANQRTDKYGGSLENRARLMLEITAAVAAAIGKDKVGVRLSPLNSYNGMKLADPVATVTYLAKQFQEQGLGYLHIMRADFFQAQQGDVVTPARENFKGLVMVNMGLTADEAEASLAKGSYDLACFGTKFLANPDFVARTKEGKALNDMDPSTFYTTDAKGYTDYPFAE